MAILKPFLIIFFFIPLGVVGQMTSPDFSNAWQTTMQKWYFQKSKCDTMTCLTYFPIDSSFKKTSYIKSKKIWYTYYSNGNIKECGQFERRYRFFKSIKFDKDVTYYSKTGIWTMYSENRELVRKLMFKKGRILNEKGEIIPYSEENRIWH